MEILRESGTWTWGRGSAKKCQRPPANGQKLDRGLEEILFWAWEGINLASTWLHNYEMIHFCCLSHPGCGTWLRQVAQEHLIHPAQLAVYKGLTSHLWLPSWKVKILNLRITVQSPCRQDSFGDSRLSKAPKAPAFKKGRIGMSCMNYILCL